MSCASVGDSVVQLLLLVSMWLSACPNKLFALLACSNKLPCNCSLIALATGFTTGDGDLVSLFGLDLSIGGAFGSDVVSAKRVNSMVSICSSVNDVALGGDRLSVDVALFC